MKIVQEEFRISTKSRNQMIDITSQIRSFVSQSDISNGDVIVYCPHTTAAITINENADPSVPHDILLIWRNCCLIIARVIGILRVIQMHTVKAL